MKATKVVAATLASLTLAGSPAPTAVADQVNRFSADIRSIFCTAALPGGLEVRVHLSRSLVEGDPLAISGMDLFIGPDVATILYEARLFGGHYDPPPLGETHGESSLPLVEVSPDIPELGTASVTIDYALGRVVDRRTLHGPQDTNVRGTIQDVFREILVSNATLRIDDGPVANLTCSGTQVVETVWSNAPTNIVIHTDFLMPSGECTATNSTDFVLYALSENEQKYSLFVTGFTDRPGIAAVGENFSLVGLKWAGTAVLVDETGIVGTTPAKASLEKVGQPLRSSFSEPGLESTTTLTPMLFTADVQGLGDPVHATCPVFRRQERISFPYP